MNITILASNLTGNTTGRAILLAEALTRDHVVKIVGPLFGGPVWGPAASSQVDIQAVPGASVPRFIRSAKQILSKVDGDIVIACKPLLASFGIGMLARTLTGRPLILDVDDDELAMTAPGIKARLSTKLRDPTGRLYTRLTNAFARRADGHFCIAECYRERFGGVIVPHGKDVDAVNPSNFDRAMARAELQLSPATVVIGFVGTPRPHKGVDLILAAIEQLDRPEIKLMVVGAEDDDPYMLQLRNRYGEKLMPIAPQPMAQMPKYLAAADIVALPQRSTPAGEGQVPAKLFDAMAMGKPIVASAVGDIPSYLADCGILVPPGDVKALASAIRQLVDNPEYARALGNKARTRCVEKYSFGAMLGAMNQEIDQALRN